MSGQINILQSLIVKVRSLVVKNLLFLKHTPPSKRRSSSQVQTHLRCSPAFVLPHSQQSFQHEKGDLDLGVNGGQHSHFTTDVPDQTVRTAEARINVESDTCLFVHLFDCGLSEKP